MPLSVLQPKGLARTTYALLAGSGLAFTLTLDAESVRIIVGDWAPTVTGSMLLIGSVICIFGSLTGRYAVEAAGFPFLVGVWLVYAVAIAVRHFDRNDTAPLGFALLLAAGGTALLGRGIEMVKAYRIDRDLQLRQQTRSRRS